MSVWRPLVVVTALLVVATTEMPATAWANGRPSGSGHVINESLVGDRPSVASSVWGTDTTGALNSSTSTTTSYPSLSPTGAGELYFGYSYVAHTASAGSTPGFSYATTAEHNEVAWNTNVSAPNAYQPTAAQSPAGLSSSVGATFKAPAASISAVGSLATADASGLTTMSVKPQTAGDLLVLSAMVATTGFTVSSVSGGGVTTWTKAVGLAGSAGIDEEIWYGRVATTGSSTITVTWSGSIAGHIGEYSAQEFTAGSDLLPDLGMAPLTDFSIDTTTLPGHRLLRYSATMVNVGAGPLELHGSRPSTTTTTSYPGVSPTGAGELYFGYSYVAHTASAGSTPGFSYATTAEHNEVAWNTNVSAPNAYQPTAAQSPAGLSSSVGATFKAPAASISAVGSLATADASGLTTMSVKPQTAGDLLVLSAMVATTGFTVSSVSGGGVTTWTKAVGLAGSAGIDEEIWYGRVATTGSSTITVTWSGSIAGHIGEYSAQEFTAGQGSGWATDTTGTLSNGSSPTDMAVTQRVYTSAGGYVDEPTPLVMYYAGDGHDHWHTKDIEGAALTRVDNGQQVGVLAKEGFCFFDNVKYMLALPGAPQSATYVEPPSCSPGQPGALSASMGLSVGWGDLYAASIAFQYIDITGVPDGTYLLTASANPNDQAIESNYSNDSVWAELQITSTSVTVLQTGPGTAP